MTRRVAKAASAAAAALLCLLGAWVITEATHLVRVEFLSMPARRQVIRWLYDGVEVDKAVWERTRGQLLAAVALEPDYTELHDFLASLHFVVAIDPVTEEVERRRLLEASIKHHQASLAIVPRNALGWAELTVTRRMLQHSNELVIADWKRALDYGPYELQVQDLLASVALAIWDEAAPAMKDWVLDLYRRAEPARQRELEQNAGDFDIDLRFEAFGPE